MAVTSWNFQFLGHHNTLFVDCAASAERNAIMDPNTAVIKLRQLSEMLTEDTATYLGVNLDGYERQLDRLRLLQDLNAVPYEVAELLHKIRKAGNQATHEYSGTTSQALHLLKLSRQIAVWFHRSFRDPNFKPGPFIPPPDPGQQAKEAAFELAQLRKALKQHKEAEATYKAAAEEARARLSELEESAETARRDQQEWQALALSLEAEFEETKALLEEARCERPAPSADEAKRLRFQSRQAGELIELDEADTRRLIDDQLREAGWEVDSRLLNHREGTRPEKKRRLAIAEWPTDKGVADYALFIGTRAVGVIEAKRQRVDASAALEQAKRYSRSFRFSDAAEAGGPWADYAVPFLFASNGRPFLQQARAKSGIWFRDARRPQNLARPLAGWPTPDGLRRLLEQDFDRAFERLKAEPTGYLGLRDYQLDAIAAVEASLARGRRSMLLAMATGTGKTRTCLGLVYRLIKCGLFRRVLFLVDRTSLGEQAYDAVRNTPLEGLQSLDKIFDVKTLSDIEPAEETRLHFATVQGMVRRIFGGESGSVPIDQYDCIVVDEAHRGYNLDREMSELEMSFRDEKDYISKYRRVLDHFDAVKIALTATPALHTCEIFSAAGEDSAPIYTYSYRQAVIDGWLIDHEPPVRIVTRQLEDGLRWEAGEEVLTLENIGGEPVAHTAPDEVAVDIDGFNKRVLTDSFNQVVCRELARRIDPTSPGKTLVFAATDHHADSLVDFLKAAFKEEYGTVDDDAVIKITGKADRPGQLIRRFKNERTPSVVVTVDLLTTGIDVPAITDIVFVRRVRSRILYEQMLGRATRRCDDIRKETFRIFDAVDLYSALLEHSNMRPVVTNPRLSFEQLVGELSGVEDPEARSLVRDQLMAKLQRRLRGMKGAVRERFQDLTGQSPEEVLDSLKLMEPEELAGWFEENRGLARFLDTLPGGPAPYIVSTEADELLEVSVGYGEGKQRPEDYLEGFSSFIKENINLIPALMVVTRRPRELTREHLKALRRSLEEAGFREAALRSAWREAKNEDIAASIIGFIRRQALDSPLVPYDQRVERALGRILGRRDWNDKQRQWLERIGKQIKAEVVVDRAAFDRGRFKSEGGFKRINRIFDGQLEAILGDLNESVWEDAS